MCLMYFFVVVAYEFSVFLLSFDLSFPVFRGTLTVNRAVKGRASVRFFHSALISCSFFFCFFFLRGTQTINLTVTNGGPLPFAYDILTAAFEYGNRAFTQYPPDIPDYFKQTFPNGYSWERIMEFEGGAKCLVKSVIRLVKS